MANLTSLPLQLDAKRGRCRAIIESPKGSGCKFTGIGGPRRALKHLARYRKKKS